MEDERRRPTFREAITRIREPFQAFGLTLERDSQRLVVGIRERSKLLLQGNRGSGEITGIVTLGGIVIFIAGIGLIATVGPKDPNGLAPIGGMMAIVGMGMGVFGSLSLFDI